MLIRFKVGNFLSFDEVQEFSMIAGQTRSKQERVFKDKDNLKLLKFGSVFGSNASGKSNLIKAVYFAQFVLRQGEFKVPANNYFKLKEENKNKPSYFEFEIKRGNKYYAYGFELMLSQGQLLSEWLYEIKKDASHPIFKRDIGNKKIDNFLNISSRLLKNKFSVYSDDIKDNPNVFFLKDINSKGNSIFIQKSEILIFKEIYDWICNSINIILPSTVSEFNYILNKESNYERICEIITAFGTGISNYEIKESSLDEYDNLSFQDKALVLNLIANAKRDLQNNPSLKDKNGNIAFTSRSADNFLVIECPTDSDKMSVKTLHFKHGSQYLNFEEESDGTKRLFDFIEILISSEDKIYFVDELDRSLHPQLTRKFIETFLSISKTKNTQLVITTHESRLLDLDLLRRDEIWFIDKDNSGATSLYSLDEYNERFDKKIDKAYLEGRYGGVPAFNLIYPNIGEVYED
ncbi:MAG: ATP-binding protein [Methanimicrococcus sp.]|nr:ATP-binding protein [Methanimicrococcus sp.]